MATSAAGVVPSRLGVVILCASRLPSAGASSQLAIVGAKDVGLTAEDAASAAAAGALSEPEEDFATILRVQAESPQWVRLA